MKSSEINPQKQIIRPVVGKNYVHLEKARFSPHFRESLNIYDRLPDNGAPCCFRRVQVSPKSAPRKPRFAAPTLSPQPQQQTPTPDLVGPRPLGVALAVVGRLKDLTLLRSAERCH
jgi:hypothetical protein